MLNANQGLSNLLKYLIQTNKIEVHYCKHQECKHVAMYRGILKDPDNHNPYGILTHGNMNYRCQQHQDDLAHYSELSIDPLITSLIPWMEDNGNEQ